MTHTLSGSIQRWVRRLKLNRDQRTIRLGPKSIDSKLIGTKVLVQNPSILDQDRPKISDLIRTNKKFQTSDRTGSDQDHHKFSNLGPDREQQNFVNLGPIRTGPWISGHMYQGYISGHMVGFESISVKISAINFRIFWMIIEWQPKYFICFPS